MTEETFDQWAILEVMGHRVLAGRVRSPAGPGALGQMLRIDVFAGAATEATATQFYAAASIFSITPTTEKVCRERAALYRRPAPALLGSSGYGPEDEDLDEEL